MTDKTKDENCKDNKQQVTEKMQELLLGKCQCMSLE